MEAVEYHTPEGMAKHLAGYIKDPSTIRVRVLEHFGRAPNVYQINALFPKQQEFRQDIGEPTDHDEIVFDARIPVEPPPQPNKKWVAPTPTNHPWPKWYTPPCQKFPFADLVRLISADFGSNSTELLGATRTEDLVAARSIIIRILRERGHSFPMIGRLMAGRDHSTVINALNKFDYYAKRDPRVREAYNRYRDGGGLLNAA